MIKELRLSEAVLKKYREQKNVIRLSGESNLNYGKIYIMTDMDPDGNDIQCLLLQFFSHWPDLFNQKRMSRLNSPLYIARPNDSKKDPKYYFTKRDFEKDKNNLKGFSIEYIKGLGSLLEEDYHYAINNPHETMINLDDDALNKLEMAFSKDSQKRKEWILDN